MKITKRITSSIVIVFLLLVNVQLIFVSKLMAEDAKADTAAKLEDKAGAKAEAQTKAKTGIDKPPKGMVLIPAGSFSMGSETGDWDEVPIHEVPIGPFFIDQHEVTNRMYKKFVDVNPQWSKEKIPSKYHDGDYLKHWKNGTYPPALADHPVVYVSWYAADAYAKWAGKSLPDETRWEKAACVNLVDNQFMKNHKYKWGVGNIFDPYLANTAHYHSLPVGGFWSDWWVNFKVDIEKKFEAGEITSEVGRFPAGVNNLYDITGNVWEWCADWYQGDSYERRRQSLKLGTDKVEKKRARYDLLYEPSSIKDKGAMSGTFRVVRGGSWADTDNICRAANRYKLRPNFTSDEIGFRCIKVIQ